MNFNHITNGRFENSADGWTLSDRADYRASDGDDHHGMVNLRWNHYMEQQFSIAGARLETIHVALKSSTALSGANAFALRIMDGAGNIVSTYNPDVPYVDQWTVVTHDVGLTSGTTYTLRITNIQPIPVMVDDVWIWDLAITRRQLAMRVHEKLGGLTSSDVTLSYAASANKPEGDYTSAIDVALREIGAIHPATQLPDIRAADIFDVDLLLDSTEREMLERIENEYITKVDLSVGPHRESFSQVASALRARIGEESVGKIESRRLTHE